MHGFKPKTSKKISICKKKNVTLDSKHKEIVNEFITDNQVNLPNYEKEKQILETRLKNKTLSIEERLDTKDKKKLINKNIKELEIKQKNYYLDNSKYIFDYFEEKQNIAMDNDMSTINKNNLVNNFFNIKTNEINQNDILQQNNIQRYLCNVDNSFLSMKNYIFQTDVCNYCYKGELIPLEDEGVMICNNCSRNTPYLIENDKPSYKEPPKEICFYAYKRINHFKEIIAQFQGKETTQIPPEVIYNIKNQIKKERIGLSDITNQKTKEILKNLGYNKYYEHIQFIKEKLGIKPPVMSLELEETLCNLFIELQSPYSKYCPDDRVNFLNYYYTAYKLCELLGKTEYLDLFPMLKDREKRIEQDNIWKKICEELDWEFIPTM